MNKIEREVKEKLKNYVKGDIIFLKSRWRKWIEEGKFDLLIKKTGANPQVVYDVLEPSKIKSIRLAKYDNGYSIILYHSSNYEIEVILKFDEFNKGDLGIVTYYKQKIKQK